MAKWQGTQVPNSGYVEKVYFNTNLSVEEVVSLLSKLETNENNAGFILVSEDSLIGFMYLEGTYGILNSVTEELYFISNDLGWGFVGWNTAISYPLIINNNVVNSFQMEGNNFVSGTQNNLITELFSTTPFTQSQQTTADKLQKLVDGKQYVVDKTNAKAGTSLNIKSKWKELGDAIEGIESGIDTTDATAVSGDIRLGKTAYVGTGKISGTIEDYDGAYEGEAVNELAKYIQRDCTEFNYYVDSIGEYIDYSNLKLTSINLPITTSIGKYAFHGCNNVKSLIAPNLTIINDYALRGCRYESVDLPNLISVGTECFKDNSKLLSVNMPKLEIIGPTCFNNCTKLPSVDFPNVKTVGAGAFYGCTILENVNLPNVITLNSQCFGSCKKLNNLKLPNVNTIPTNTFSYSNALTDLYLGYNGVVSLANVSAFNSGATNTTVHVRPEYADKYATATNWSSLITSGRITIVGDYSD